MTVSTDGNVDEVGLSNLFPGGSSSDGGADSLSEIDLVGIINTPKASISSNVDVDHLGNTWWLGDLRPIGLALLFEITDLLEPDVVSVVYAPENWSVSDRDVHKFTSKLGPVRTFLVSIGSDVLSAHDIVVRSNTADLAVSDIDVDEVGFNHSP
jgi:hypothetical protein